VSTHPDTENATAALVGAPFAHFDSEELDAAEKAFRQTCEFLKGVVNVAGLPEGSRAEVAFAGRSNVGKSSLLNALLGRRDLARTSNTPGRTRELNFFDLSGALYLVDMPGYGYAQAPKSQVAGWTALVHDYLRGRPGLRRVYLLIDSRHGIKPSDREIMKMMDKAAVSYQIVLTKIDKLKVGELAAIGSQAAAILAKHPAAYPQMIATSSAKGDGIADLRAAVAAASAE
jgi:GTP-binding protein